MSSNLPTLNQDAETYVLNLGDSENTIDPAWLDTIEKHLTTLEHASDPAALLTVATGKSSSNGLDLGWVTAHQSEIPQFSARVEAVLGRFLELPLPSVAALQGHAFGAGAMLALAHDQRLMRADRGYFCFPEVDIKIPFTLGMNDLICAKLPADTANEAMTSGRRYSGGDALAARIVAAAVPEEELQTQAAVLATSLAPKAGPVLGTIKQRLYRNALRSLRDPSNQ